MEKAKEVSSGAYGAVSSGHPTAAEIARDVLEAGGNAVDAGVAASIALTVLKSEQVQLGGVAVMLIYAAAEDRTHVVEGAGRWPAATDPCVFETRYRGRVPRGILRSVVPAAPDAWIAALSRFGTKRFAELAEPARRLAEVGFPAHADLAACSAQFARAFSRYPENAGIWLSNGEPIREGAAFRQPGLARALDTLIEADRAGCAAGGREAGLQAVRSEFYRGSLARRMIDHVSSEGGWLSLEDLAAHVTPVVEATRARLSCGELYLCGPWSQGPALAQALQIVGYAVADGRAGSEADFLHTLLEAMKLALADREAFYGDPDFVDCNVDALLSPEHARERARLIDPERAMPGLPEAAEPPVAISRPPSHRFSTPDTSYALVCDRHGNLFACTPSDASHEAPAVPGLGFVISTRGGQSHAAHEHPACVAPGKRPRVTACPFAFRSAAGDWIIGGGPGADLQLQAAVQVLARHLFRGETLERALAAPRVFTQSVPGSNDPHYCFPGQILVEEEAEQAIVDELSCRGHNAVRGPTQGIARPSLGLVDTRRGRSPQAYGDPRRPGGTFAGRLSGRSAAQ